MKTVTVVGARPQFIKAAALSRILRKEHQEVLIHTGQHYDKGMSEIFFEEPGIPKSDYNLGIACGGHGQMTGRMLEHIETILEKDKPQMLLVYGDTNSTLAGALAAVKLHIPVIHVEAGGRLGTLQNPEEVNRILTDHISAVLFACTASAVNFLAHEGIREHVHLVGDPMYDAFLYYKQGISSKDLVFSDVSGHPVNLPQSYYYLICHREENTADESVLFEIMRAMNCLDAPTVYLLHPRNRAMACALKERYGFEQVILADPVGYKTSIGLVSHAKKVVTDSGGVQREAFFAGVQCVTVFKHVVWPETMGGNCNQLARPESADILSKLEAPMVRDLKETPFGDGHACEKMVEILRSYP